MKLKELIKKLQKLESKYGEAEILLYDGCEEAMQSLSDCEVCSQPEAVRNYYCRGDNEAEDYPEDTQFVVLF